MVVYFDDNIIDLIYIDGLYIYEVVKYDYEIWWSKLRKGGLIMFYDWNVREVDFGVWKFWEEIKIEGSFECIEMMNGYGLVIVIKINLKLEWYDELVKLLFVLKIKGWLLDELRRIKDFL